MDISAVMTREAGDVLGQGTETMHAARIMITNMQHGDGRVRPLPGNLMLGGHGIEPAGRVDSDTKRVGDTLELRDHAGRLAPPRQATGLPGLPVKT